MKPNLLLKFERERRGWSQARVAQEIGSDPQSVSRWERGKSFPYPYLREKLCVLFEMDAIALGLLPGGKESAPISTFQQLGPPRKYLVDPLIPLPTATMKTLIGRYDLLVQLKQRLLYGEPGALTLLYGLPGVGKSVLTSVLAYDPDIQSHFHGGIFWAGVGPDPDLAALLSRWGMLSGCSVARSKTRSCEDWARAIRTHIDQHPALFIIDDVWQLDAVLTLKIGGHASAHLVTTRVPSITRHFSPEGVWRVPLLSELESLELLARFVPALVRDDQRIADTLVEPAGGLPLALTLIGRYLRAQSGTGQPRRLATAVQQVLDAAYRLHLSELSSLPDRPPSLPADTPLSLEAIIAVSIQQISARERHALYALSVFPAQPNSFSEDAAQAICQEPVTVFDTLSDAGLLESPEPGRYQLHQTIADYARTHTTQEESAIRRFVVYIAGILETHSGVSDTDFDVLEIERENILFALEKAVALELHKEYVQSVIAFTPFLTMRGDYILARTHLHRAYSIVRESNDEQSLLYILSRLALIAQEQGQLIEAESFLQEGLQRARQSGHQDTINHFLMRLADLLEERRDYVQARSYLRAGLSPLRSFLGNELTFYDRIIADYSGNTLRVHFTEPQQMIQRGYLADISEQFYNWPLAKYLDPAHLKIVTGPDKRIYGIPTATYAFCLAYNRRLFCEAGLDPDHPPSTWSEFRLAAQRLTNVRKGVYGFVFPSLHNMGGWHFSGWSYTAGVRGQEQHQGKWRANFNHSNAIEFLEMLKDMRFADQSLPERTLLSGAEIEKLFALGQVAMIVSSAEILTIVREHAIQGCATIDINDIGLAPVPQHGGNAFLVGGLAHVFPAGLSPRALQTAFDQVTTMYFDLNNYETALKATVAQGKPVGVPSRPLFSGSLYEYLCAIREQYINIPLEQYFLYQEETLTALPEPSIEAQRYYAMIDPIVQTVLSDYRSLPGNMLNAAAERFQRRFLEHYRMPSDVL